MAKRRNRQSSQPANKPAEETLTPEKLFPDPQAEDLSRPKGVESLKEEEAFSAEYHAAVATGEVSQDEWELLTEGERQELSDRNILPIRLPEDEVMTDEESRQLWESLPRAELHPDAMETVADDLVLEEEQEPESPVVVDAATMAKAFASVSPENAKQQLLRALAAGPVTVREFSRLAEVDDNRKAQLELHRLCQEGLVKAEWRDSANRYALTAAGRQIV